MNITVVVLQKSLIGDGVIGIRFQDVRRGSYGFLFFDLALTTTTQNSKASVCACGARSSRQEATVHSRRENSLGEDEVDVAS